jgi:hypothetical protein
VSAAGQPDIVTVEGRRSLQLDIQVRCPSLFLASRHIYCSPLTSTHSPTQYTQFKTHSRTSHVPDLRKSAYPARAPAKRTNKSRCSSRCFQLYLSYISSASPTTRPRVASSRVASLSSSPRSSKSLQVSFSPFPFFCGSQAEDPS